MKKYLIFLAAVMGIFILGFSYRYLTPQPKEKVYVAVEGESKIVIFNPTTQKIISVIDLSIDHEGGKISYAPHNVQVSPDMNTVWITANASKHEEHSWLGIKSVLAHGEVEAGDEADQIIIISTKTDRIIKRLPVGEGIQLAHVALTPDNAYAYVTAQKEGVTYKINATTHTLVKEIKTPQASEPHGIRIAPDGSKAYIAMLKGKSLGIIDLPTDSFSEVSLGGAAVQTGVTPDGKFAVASLYDTKQLAVYDLTLKELKKVQLPQGAKGPVQMYPTPNSKFMYLADQGYYFNQPANNLVYKIDLQKLEVVKEIKAGSGPHGVVISPNGKLIYVTNLLSNDVSIISTATDEEVSRIKVGKEPNGISVWIKQ